MQKKMIVFFLIFLLKINHSCQAMEKDFSLSDFDDEILIMCIKELMLNSDNNPFSALKESNKILQLNKRFNTLKDTIYHLQAISLIDRYFALDEDNKKLFEKCKKTIPTGRNKKFQAESAFRCGILDLKTMGNCGLLLEKYLLVLNTHDSLREKIQKLSNKANAQRKIGRQFYKLEKNISKTHPLNQYISDAIYLGHYIEKLNHIRLQQLLVTTNNPINNGFYKEDFDFFKIKSFVTKHTKNQTDTSRILGYIKISKNFREGSGIPATRYDFKKNILINHFLCSLPLESYSDNMSKESKDLFTDAINGNCDKIKENLDLLTIKDETHGQNFINIYLRHKNDPTKLIPVIQKILNYDKKSVIESLLSPDCSRNNSFSLAILTKCESLVSIIAKLYVKKHMNSGPCMTDNFHLYCAYKTKNKNIMELVTYAEKCYAIRPNSVSIKISIEKKEPENPKKKLQLKEISSIYEKTVTRTFNINLKELELYGFRIVKDYIKYNHKEAMKLLCHNCIKYTLDEREERFENLREFEPKESC